MENKKEYTQIGEQLIQAGQVGSGSTLVQETITKPTIPELEPYILEEIKEAPARIPNALFSSLLSTREYTDLKSLELDIDIEDKDIKKAVDEEGKPIRLTKRQDRILLALSSEFSKYRNEPKIKTLIERTEKGDSFSSEDTDTLIRLWIDLEELTGKIEGARKRRDTTKQDILHKELKKLSEIRQLISFKIKQKVSTTEYKDFILKDIDYYFVLTGGTKEIVINKEKDKRKKKLEIIFGRVFYERLDSRAILLPDEYWELKDSTGRKISTTIFTDLTKEVFKLRWSHIYYDLPKAEEYIKKKGILDTETKEKIIKRALTHTIKADKIKEITNADYTGTRKRKDDFWIDLWEAIRAFIVLGVLTQETEINKEDGSIKLVYNPKYEQSRKGIENIDIGYWYNNPFKKKKK